MSRVRVASTHLSSRTDRRALLAVWFAIALTACHATPRPAVTPDTPDLSATGRLRRQIDAILAAPALARSTWGILVRSTKNEDVLYSWNPGKLLMPGSTMKVVTLAAAADRLGWDHVYDTRLVAAGTIDSGAGILNGDLVVVGSGDPSIVEADGTAARLFAEWTVALKQRGIRMVTGRIVGDDNAFDDETLGPGWAWDDLPGRDATAISALQFNENVALATVTPGASVGEPAAVAIAPAGSDLVLDDRLTTAPEATPTTITARRPAGSNRLELRGNVSLGSAPILRAVSVDNPTLFFVSALRGALVDAGIEIRGAAVDIDDLAATPISDLRTELSIHYSPPLSQLAVRLMKNSQNLYADTIIKTLGGSSGAPSFENGRQVAASTLVPWGVDPGGIVQVDGSGLSRYNYVTADGLVTILLHVDRDKVLRGPFESALPVAGVDGTLATRMKGTAAEGNARAKSGTLANVRSLAGYVSTADDESVVFAIIANNFGTMPEVAISAIDEIVATLAQFKR
jgi:serine-type D-Ala-D-Ala carboxypeptidase/endopeptidase (penicillin-binding protein 4)